MKEEINEVSDATAARTVEQVGCLICGSKVFKHFRSGDRNLNLLPPLRVVRCASCGLLFLNPRPSLDARMDIFAGRRPKGLEPYLDNPANYGAVTKTRSALFELRVKRLNEKYFNNRSVRVLDVGASSGEFMEAARLTGWKVFGVEPSAEGLRTTREKGLEVFDAPAERLPFEDDTFDLVHSNHVFEHLADPLAAAREAFRVVRPGGVVFIEVPNQFDNIQFFRYRLFGKIPVRVRNVRSIHHLVFFSRKALKRLLEEAGFGEIIIKNKYGRRRKGIGMLGSIVMRIFGSVYLGAPFIQAIAIKK